MTTSTSDISQATQKSKSTLVAKSRKYYFVILMPEHLRGQYVIS